MRKSILALSVGGLLAAAALLPETALANHRWTPERGWQAGHGRPVVVVRPPQRDVIVRRTPRRTVVIHPDGSRTIYRHRPRHEQVVVVPGYPRYPGY